MTRGLLPPCEACAAAKAKQKNASKDSNHIPMKNINERISLDLCMIRDATGQRVTRANWRIMVDQLTH